MAGRGNGQAQRIDKTYDYVDENGELLFQVVRYKPKDFRRDLLKLYLDEFRPRLASEDNPWLFPGRDGKHKVPAVLARQISDVLLRKTGLEVNAHLFRHIAAKLYLDANPGGYEVVRRVLGHRSMETTVTAYAGMETAAATRHFDQQILKLRNRSPVPEQRIGK